MEPRGPIPWAHRCQWGVGGLYVKEITGGIRLNSHMLKNHIKPTFSSKRLDEIKPLHVVSFLKTLEQDGSRMDGKSGGLSSTSIRFIHRNMKDIFERAVEWKYTLR